MASSNVVLFGLSVLVYTSSHVGCLRPEITCEEFSHPLCLDFGYNLARFPNALGHRTATQATTELYRYYSLVKAKCSRHVAAFLCGAHFPNCNQTEIALPCRSLCLQARTGCQPLLATFGLRRSDPLFQCDKFPETGNCFVGEKVVPELPDTSTEQKIEQKKESQKIAVRTKSRIMLSDFAATRRGDGDPLSQTTCEPILREVCSDLGYDKVRLPNMFGHTTSKMAHLALSQYIPTIKAGCSPELKSFLCSAYLPPCNQTDVVPHSRSLCLKARSGCEPLMRKFGFDWPENLACEKFPEAVDGPSPGEDNVKPVKRSGKRRSKTAKKRLMVSDAPATRNGGRRRGKGPGLVNRCLPFNTEFCPNTPYFTAGFPNLLGHKNPHAAEVQIARLTPLMRTGCSSRLQDFLCGVHFPECLEREIVVPCRSLCFEVLGACAETLARLNFQWPPRLRCENFPANGDCFGKGKEAIITPPRGIVKQSSPIGADKPSGGDIQSSAPDLSPAVNMFNSLNFTHPFMEWLVSSTDLNKEEHKLVREQVEVTKLEEEKLSLEISRLKKQHGDITH